MEKPLNNKLQPCDPEKGWIFLMATGISKQTEKIFHLQKKKKKSVKKLRKKVME